MELATTVIQDILEEVTVAAAEQPIPATDSNKVIRYMNRYMAALDVEGVSLGYTIIDNPTDPVTVPDGALEGIVFNVAIRILTSYGIPLTTELAQNARQSKKTLYKLGVTIKPTQYPARLPIGSGNEDDGSYSVDKFYPGTQETILTETNRDIGLEDNTNVN